ncbi:MAG: hypothetical protein SH850_16560 [Planctomycetaceae bacterium]|nr:hypothetical protein [Planctomycetaceae bacterium]
MKTALASPCESTSAELIAGENLRCGDYVATFTQMTELPSYLWDGGDYTLSPHELVRLKYTPCDAGQPLKIIAVCLPFVYAVKPDRSPVTLDLRRTQLVRLDTQCARRTWKALKGPKPVSC